MKQKFRFLKFNLCYTTLMNKLVPFKKFSKQADKFNLSDTSVMVDKTGIPLGFVFGRDSFISFLEYIDNEFEKRIEDPKLAYDNPAGKLIDLIETKLPLNPKFVKDLKSSISKTRKSDWISLDEISYSLNV